MCELTLVNTTFEDNIAITQGGSIHYTYKRPQMTNITFTNNTAAYGKNISSYAVKINFVDSDSDTMKLTNLGSGIVHDEELKFALKDNDEQIMVLNGVDQITVTPLQPDTSSIQGVNSKVLVNGISTFDEFIAITDPGSTNVKFELTSKAIDSDKVKDVLGLNVSDNILSIDFRYCKPGEYILNNTCFEWSPGSYSLIWNSTTCHQCPDHAVCLGKDQINVESGYWRRSSNSTDIMEWINQYAWTGGYESSNTYPVNCKTGYKGNLCSKWMITDSDKYQETGHFECEKWPDPVLNAIRVVGLALLVFMFFMVIIVVNVRKTTESQVSILLRILTNYLQLITLTMSFSVSYPSFLTDMLAPVMNVGDSSDTFLSFDWFSTDYNITGPFPTSSFLKVFLSLFLPLILFVIVALIWLIIHFVKRKFVKDLKRYLIITFISIVFLLHPKLTQQSISIFR